MHLFKFHGTVDARLDMLRQQKRPVKHPVKPFGDMES